MKRKLQIIISAAASLLALSAPAQDTSIPKAAPAKSGQIVQADANAATQNDASFPSQITTRDGKTYCGVEKVRVDPDGILVNYQPGPGGYGLAKLKFRNLPED